MFENIKWFFKRIYWIFHAKNYPLYFKFNATKNYCDYNEYKIYIHNKLNPTEIKNNKDIKLYHFDKMDNIIAKLVIRLLKENDLYFPTINYFLNRRITIYYNSFYNLVKQPSLLYSENYQEFIKHCFPTKLKNLHKVYVILQDLYLIHYGSKIT